MQSTEKMPLRHRRTRFDFSKVPTHWSSGDPFVTRFLDALSINFPLGERFFIEAVSAFAERVSDPSLREEIALFSRQEGQHGGAHSQYNKLLRAQGVDVDKILQVLAGHKRATQRLAPELQLALTAAAEHLTATLAEGLLEDASFLGERADPEMRALYLWHAVEEVEHKAVAFDVYQRFAGGSYWLRVRAMLMITVYLHLRVSALMGHMFEVDRLQDRRAIVRRGLWRLYGPRGLLTRMLPSYLAWFKPGFHPWDSGMPSQASRWAEAYAQHEDVRAATAALG
jgi:predicted metal-dependent hydrolase